MESAQRPPIKEQAEAEGVSQAEIGDRALRHFFSGGEGLKVVDSGDRAATGLPGLSPGIVALHLACLRFDEGDTQQRKEVWFFSHRNNRTVPCP